MRKFSITYDTLAIMWYITCIQIPDVEAALTRASCMWSIYITVCLLSKFMQFAQKQRCPSQPWNSLHDWQGHNYLFLCQLYIWLASLCATASIRLHRNIAIARLCTQSHPYCYRRLRYSTHTSNLYNSDYDMHCSCKFSHHAHQHVKCKTWVTVECDHYINGDKNMESSCQTFTKN